MLQRKRAREAEDKANRKEQEKAEIKEPQRAATSAEVAKLAEEQERALSESFDFLEINERGEIDPMELKAATCAPSSESEKNKFMK